MFTEALIATLLPAFILAAPTQLSARQNPACTPTCYTISDFSYSTGASSTNPHVHFKFQPTFSDLSIMTDLASNGATCDATGSSVDSFPMEAECSTGRANLLFDLRAPVDKVEFQIIHTWQCEGRTWMSSTPHKISSMSCLVSEDGTTQCTSEAQTFKPENVRQICSTPTCP